MNSTLNGCRVLVTRPKNQAENLCRLIEADGGKAVELPTLELSISGTINKQTLLAMIADAALVIFVSRNAVEFASQITGDLVTSLHGKKIIAIGDGTLRQLNAYSVYHSSSPGLRSGSEALLEMPELDAKNINGSNVLIVRGGTGREYLHEALAARGAILQYADVYERTVPVPAEKTIATVWHSSSPDIIVFTSTEGLLNLIRMTAELDKGIMFSRRLVVMSERIADTAREAGFRETILVATEQSDQGLLQAIRQTVEQKL